MLAIRLLRTICLNIACFPSEFAQIPWVWKGGGSPAPSLVRLSLKPKHIGRQGQNCEYISTGNSRRGTGGSSSRRTGREQAGHAGEASCNKMECA